MNPNRKKVTDPSLLSQLEGRKVKDPEILAKLNSEEPEEMHYDFGGLPEPEGFFAKLPRNVLAGLAGLGERTLNEPHELTSGLESRLQTMLPGVNQGLERILPVNRIPKEFQSNREVTHPISQFIPEKEHIDYAQLLGQPGEGTLSDRLIQGLIGHAPEVATGAHLLRKGLEYAPITQRMAARPLKKAQKLTKERNVPFTIGKETKKLVKNAAQYLDKTQETKRLLKDAERGSYEALFSLQSQLGRESRNLAKSPLPADRRIAREPQELKHLILKSMESNLRSHGEHEIADMLKNGVAGYRRYIKLRSTVDPVLKKLGIPTTLLAALFAGKELTGKLMKD